MDKMKFSLQKKKQIYLAIDGLWDVYELEFL